LDSGLAQVCQTFFDGLYFGFQIRQILFQFRDLLGFGLITPPKTRVAFATATTFTATTATLAFALATRATAVAVACAITGCVTVSLSVFHRFLLVRLVAEETGVAANASYSARKRSS
jgi:hypothetical protein